LCEEDNEDSLDGSCDAHWFVGFYLDLLFLLFLQMARLLGLVSSHQLFVSYCASNSSVVRSSNFPVRIIFCSIYRPAAFPLATSALTAADHAPLLRACCLILPNSDMCLS